MLNLVQRSDLVIIFNTSAIDHADAVAASHTAATSHTTAAAQNVWLNQTVGLVICLILSLIRELILLLH